MEFNYLQAINRLITAFMKTFYCNTLHIKVKLQKFSYEPFAPMLFSFYGQLKRVRGPEQTKALKRW